MVRCNARNAPSSRSCERNATKPPNASPPAERIGLARPIRCSPATLAASSVPAESCANAPIAPVSATSAGSTASRGSVVPTMYGRLSVSRAKNTTSVVVACLISCARLSSTAYAATSAPCGVAVSEARSGTATAMNNLRRRSSSHAPLVWSPDRAFATRAPRDRSMSDSAG